MKKRIRQNNEKREKSEIKWFQTIKVKLSFVILAAIVITVLVDFEYMISVSKKTLIENTESSIKYITEFQSEYIDQSIEKYNATMTYIDGSEEINLFEVSGGNKFGNKVDTTLTKYIDKNPTHNSISFISASTGTVLASTNRELIGTDYRQYDFADSILDECSNAQSDVIIDEKSGKATIDVGVVQHNDKNDGSIAGALITNIDASFFTDEVSGIKVNDIEGSYACLLDSKGVYIYHPNEELIGTVTEDASILNAIENGTCDKLGTMKLNTTTNEYGSYSVSEKNGWILAVFVPAEEILRPINNMKITSLIINLIIMAIMSSVAFGFASTIIKPVKGVTSVVNDTANLDLRENEKSSKLSKKKDEIGQMSRAVVKMRHAIRQMLETINGVSEKISGNAKTLESISVQVNDSANDNLSASEQLLASMNVTKHNTNQMAQDASNIGDYAASISNVTEDGVRLSKEILTRADNMKINTVNAKNSTSDMYRQVKMDTTEAIERSQSVTRINEFANSIKEIASQTRLLSLNASIEAARAGESGRGFAVVAGEIGKLAQQSSTTVENITVIVDEVVEAVNELIGCMSTVLEFLEDKVMADYDSFVEISEKYSEDADSIGNTMLNIDNSINGLNNSVKQIAEMITGINVAMDESTKGIEEVTSSTEKITRMIEDTMKMSKDTMTFAGELDNIVMKFKLD